MFSKHNEVTGAEQTIWRARRFDLFFPSCLGNFRAVTVRVITNAQKTSAVLRITGDDG